ncbi:hypothetical protein E3Q18_03559 [Wallemia mellicola]|nr:hypothetical protein E3Q18_03559 [Wallemia mellicola]TIC24244.1 hypothetical protein E3Q11_03706 [Wallemia mellicola]TIC73118.1 hypothetical protein E3Q00_03287 [Wallemia mellicola]
MLDLVALVIISSDAMLALSICILSLIIVVLVHLTVTRILLVRPEVAENLRKPTACSVLQNQVTTVGLISDDFQPDGACWVNEMHTINQTTLDEYLQEVGQPKLNYTIYTTGQSASEENYHNGDNSLASDLAGKAILTRASYPRMNTLLVSYQAARLATGLVAHVILTGIGTLTSSFGVYRNDWEMTATGFIALFVATGLGYSTSPFPTKGMTQTANNASTHEREIGARDALKQHVNLSGKGMDSDISAWQLMGSENSHHQYQKIGDSNGYGHQILVLFRKSNLSVKSKRRDGRAGAYGLRYTCYEPNKDPFLQQSHSGAIYNANNPENFVLGTLTIHGTVIGCVYFDLPWNTLNRNGKIELLTAQNPDTGTA